MDFERLLTPTNTLKMLTFNFYISVVACLKLDLPQPYIMAVVRIITHNNE